MLFTTLKQLGNHMRRRAYIISFLVLILFVFSLWLLTPAFVSNVYTSENQYFEMYRGYIGVDKFPDKLSLPKETGGFGDIFGAVNALFAGLAFIGAVMAIIIQSIELSGTNKQMKEQARIQGLQIKAQLITNIKSLSNEYRFIEGMQVIRRLPNEAKVSDFESVGLSASDRDLIIKTVDFLNYISHLVFSELLDRQDVWNVYFTAFKTCHAKLLPHWIKEHRESYDYGYAAFEDMCVLVSSIPPADIPTFREKEKSQRTKKLG